jgi:hypothetical protein
MKLIQRRNSLCITKSPKKANNPEVARVFTCRSLDFMGQKLPFSSTYNYAFSIHFDPAYALQELERQSGTLRRERTPNAAHDALSNASIYQNLYPACDDISTTALEIYKISKEVLGPDRFTSEQNRAIFALGSLRAQSA